MSKVITDRYVHDVYPFAGGGGPDSRSALPPRCHVVEHARRRRGSASGNDVASRLHSSYRQGDRGGTEDDPFALVAPVPGVQHKAALMAGGNDVAPNLHNTTEGISLRFRWNGCYGYRTLPGTNVLHVGARHYSPQLRRWLQRDPAGLAGTSPNLYQYCRNRATAAVDPGGFDPRSPDRFEESVIALALGLIRRAAPEVADDIRRSVRVLVDDELERGALGTIGSDCIILKPDWPEPAKKLHWEHMRYYAVGAAATIVHEYYHLKKQSSYWAKLASLGAYLGTWAWATLGVMFSPLNNVEQPRGHVLAAYEEPAYSFSVGFLDKLLTLRPDLDKLIVERRAEICAAFRQSYGQSVGGR